MEMLDTFHLPIVYLVDCPGFMIGEEAERSGIARAAMRAIQTTLSVEVPIITLHTRKAYGMGPMVSTNASKSHLRLAWPSAQWGDFPAEGGVDAVFRREIEAAENPGEYRRQAEALINQYISPWGTAEGFGVEEMIDPAETREYLAKFVTAAWPGMKRLVGQPQKYRPRI
jgi:acetyl-CoA carboxylase carboxyltransferase component